MPRIYAIGYALAVFVYSIYIAEHSVELARDDDGSDDGGYRPLAALQTLRSVPDGARWSLDMCME